MPLVLIEEIMDKADSKYRLVILAAKRSKQINRGAPPLVQPRSVKPTYVALEELAAGAIDFSVVPLEEAARAGMLAVEGTKPTWFRDLAPEPVAVGEEGEEAAPEVEGTEEVAAVGEEPVAAGAVESPVPGEPELVDLDVLERPEEKEEE